MKELILMLQENLWLALLSAGLFGLCVGSFLNVVIYRTPLIMHQEARKESAEYWRDETTLPQAHKDGLLDYIKDETPISLSSPASTCPNCGHQIRWFENIPVLSWLVLRGACSDCHNPISFRYPFVEIATASLSVLAILILGATLQGLVSLLFIWILVALIGIDFDTKLLPDRLVFPLGMMGLILNSFGIFVSPVSAIWGAVFGFLILWIITAVYALFFKKQAMGTGDFKLLAALGAWLGVGMLPLIVILSSLIGSIIGIGLFIIHRKSIPFAFGPYLALAGIVALFFGQDIIAWYLGQFSK